MIQTCVPRQAHKRDQSKLPAKHIHSTRAMEIIQIDLLGYGSKRYLLAVEYFTVLICLGRLLAKYTEWEWDKLDSMFTDYGRSTKLISDFPSSACRQGTGRGLPTDGQRGTFKLFKNLLEKDWLWCECFTQRYYLIVKRHAHIFRNFIPFTPSFLRKVKTHLPVCC